MSGPSTAGASEDRSLNDAAKGFPKIHPDLTDRNCGPTPGAGPTSRRQGRGGGRDKAEEPRHGNRGAANDRANTRHQHNTPPGDSASPRESILSAPTPQMGFSACAFARRQQGPFQPASGPIMCREGGSRGLPLGATRRFLPQAASRVFRCG